MWLTGTAAVGLAAKMGYEQYQAVQFSNRFENQDTERFLHDVVGLDDSAAHHLTYELRNCTHRGFGPGVMVQALALSKGYNPENPGDLRLYKHYLNSLTQGQMAVLVEESHKILDGMDTKSQPTTNDMNKAEYTTRLAANLEERGVPLPPVRLVDLTPPPAQPKNPPVVTVTPYGPGHETTDTLWGITGNNLDTILTAEQKKAILEQHLTPEQIVVIYGLPTLYALNQEKQFNGALRDWIPSASKGDPDTIHAGDRITVGRG